MKKLKILIMLLLMPKIVLAGISTERIYGTYEDAINMVQEVMSSYYLRGPYLQYNYAKSTYGVISPEDATHQDYKYAVCSAYTYDVYVEAFGMKYDKEKSPFPRYNYDISDAAREYYDKCTNPSGNIEVLDGTFLIYYENKNDNIKYIYGDKTPTDKIDDYSTLINNLKPGDLLVYTGHALIVYDVVINPITGKKDAIVLNSTMDEYIRTRIDGTSLISHNMFSTPHGLNGYLDIEAEGTVQMLWLSKSSYFIKNGTLDCQAEECAIIRPFYEGENGEAIFNYDISKEKYEKSVLRTEYPGLYIEKTVDVGDNNSVYVGNELTYTIKIANKSNTSYNSMDYSTFFIEENIDTELVEYLSSNNKSVYSDNKITWEIDKLKANESIELKYKVKVKHDTKNVSKSINAVGNFYKQKDDAKISTGSVINKIIPKVSKLNKSYNECYNLYVNKYSSLDLINEIYKCVYDINYKFDEFDFKKILTTDAGTSPKINSKINFVNELDSNHTNFKNMILHNYFNALAKVDEKYYLPRFDTSKRNRTIMPNDFKNGDILIYYIEPGNSKYTDEAGVYAFIYLNGIFIGVNGTSETKRDTFSYNYYENTKSVSEAICNKYGYDVSIECNYFYNLYAGYSKLNSENKNEILEFVNYQTLFDKDYYIILRPELIIEEIDSIKITGDIKKEYLQNKDELNLNGGMLNVLYNNGNIKEINLDSENILVEGFDNTRIGKQTLTIKYKGYETSLVINIISNLDQTIENPKTGEVGIILILVILIINVIIIYIIRRKNYIKQI